MMIKHAFKELKEKDHDSLREINHKEVDLICAMIEGKVP
jgi:hypothetical protein